MKPLYSRSLHTLFVCVSVMAPCVCMQPAEATEAAETPAAAGGASLSGRVTYGGEAPERRPIDTSADSKCVDMHGDTPLLDERAVVSPDGGVKSAFVYIKDLPEGETYPPPEETVLLDQVGCRYIPHMVGLQVNQELAIRNSDETLHNVRGLPRRNRPFNFGQPALGTRTRIFKNAEPHIKVKCDVHPWMAAYIFVLEHSLFAVTDENGAFDIPNVPPGEHTLVIWHETFGEMEAQLTVDPSGAAGLEFVFEPKE